MMRRLLLLLLALGLWQIGYTQIHCGFEPPDCQEGACELCHLGDISPLASGSSCCARRPPLRAPPWRRVKARPFSRSLAAIAAAPLPVKTRPIA